MLCNQKWSFLWNCCMQEQLWWPQIIFCVWVTCERRQNFLQVKIAYGFPRQLTEFYLRSQVIYGNLFICIVRSNCWTNPLDVFKNAENFNCTKINCCKIRSDWCILSNYFFDQRNDAFIDYLSQHTCEACGQPLPVRKTPWCSGETQTLYTFCWTLTITIACILTVVHIYGYVYNTYP